MIYLDNAATTPVSEKYKEIIDTFLYDNYGNAGSSHSLGQRARSAIEEARTKVAKALNTDSGNVIFTSSGSEANSLAIIGLANYLEKINKKHIITTRYEHHSVINTMREMERRGFSVTYLDVPDGMVSYEDLRASVNDSTGLVSVMYVNNEVGTKNNVSKIYDFCKQNNILFHSDCVQAFNMEKIDMNKVADMVTISGHKIHAPKGVGCLCIKNKEYLSSIIYGGEQEYGLRPGTENVAAIAAFGEAVAFTDLCRDEDAERISHLMLAFEKKLVRLCEREKIDFHFTINAPICPKICSVRFDGVEADTLILLLSSNNVFVSSGAACSSNAIEPSHVLKAIGLTDEDARATIRVSFSTHNSVPEVKLAAEKIVGCVKILKNLSLSSEV